MMTEPEARTMTDLEGLSMDTLRVLVIDDEAGMRSGVQRVLDGFRVTLPEADSPIPLQIDQADSGEAALGKMAEHKYDILLLDHKLPGISGWTCWNSSASARTTFCPS